MNPEPPVTAWARQRFGPRAAQTLRAIADALSTATADAQNAQKESRSEKFYPFGSTMMTRRYECIVEALSDMDDVQIVRPSGSAHQLVVLNGNLLLPFRYAQERSIPITDARVTEQRVSTLIVDLFKSFGPNPTYLQTALNLDQTDETDDTDLVALRTVLDELPEDTRLVLVAYACNARAGLLNSYCGEGELLDPQGRIRWLPGCLQQLPDPMEVSRPGDDEGGYFDARNTGPRPISPTDLSGAPSPTFSAGAMPDVPLTPRHVAERKNPHIYPPTSVPTPEKPISDDQEH